MLNELLRNRLFIAIISIVLIGLVGFGVYTLMDRAGKESVTVYALPGDATLTANGKRISTGTTYLKPGTYTIEASKNGFENYKSTIIITQPNTAVIDIALTPVSEEAIKWQQQNKKLYFEHEGRVGSRANVRGEQFSQKNPITTKLPVESFLYTIGYRTDPADQSGNSIIIEIDAMTGYREAALQKIHDLGYDPTDLTIKFLNYESPFKQ